MGVVKREDDTRRLGLILCAGGRRCQSATGKLLREAESYYANLAEMWRVSYDYMVLIIWEVCVLRREGVQEAVKNWIE